MLDTPDCRALTPTDSDRRARTSTVAWFVQIAHFGRIRSKTTSLNELSSGATARLEPDSRSRMNPRRRVDMGRERLAAAPSPTENSNRGLPLGRVADAKQKPGSARPELVRSATDWLRFRFIHKRDRSGATTGDLRGAHAPCGSRAACCYRTAAAGRQADRPTC